MEYIKPEIKFKKFYTESFLADEDIISGTADSEGDLEHEFTGTGDDFFGFDASSGVEAWFNL
ncbi:MAG: hypothetical protein IJZ57_05475 [Clostridia bacterium]|nr:hypothetical protein [Clostridia bacterium]